MLEYLVCILNWMIIGSSCNKFGHKKWVVFCDSNLQIKEARIRCNVNKDK